jgi:hypothetical protein
MTKTFAVAMAIALSSSMLPTSSARADGGQVAAGVFGGLIGGTLLGAAIASRPAPPPVYYAPPPVYVEEPACRYVGERFWDGWGWRYRRVEVCN